MQVTHPNEPFMNLPQEDVFLAMNDLGVQSGYGYVLYQYQPGVYPERPVNIFFNMECTPEAEYLLFGALVARGRQLRMGNPTEAGRMYTSLQPSDDRRIAFYEHNGLKIDNTEEVMRLQIPQSMGPDQFNCAITPLALNSPQEQQLLVDRLNAYGLTHITLPYLQQLQTAPNFHYWGLLYGQSLVGECIVSGYGPVAEVMGIYIVPEFRRRGLGKALLHRALAIMGQEGVVDARARVLTASRPQMSLFNAFGAQPLEQTLIFPCLDL